MIALRDVHKVFHQGEAEVRALAGAIDAAMRYFRR